MSNLVVSISFTVTSKQNHIRDQIKQFRIVNYEFFIICSLSTFSQAIKTIMFQKKYVPKNNYKALEINETTKKITTKT